MDLETQKIVEHGIQFNMELEKIFRNYFDKFNDNELFFKMICHGIPGFMAQTANFIIRDSEFDQKLELIDLFCDTAKHFLKNNVGTGKNLDIDNALH